MLKLCLEGNMDLIDLGRRSRRYVERYYSVEAVAARMGRLYLETADFPNNVQRQLARSVERLEAALPPVMSGVPPVPWANVAACVPIA